MILLFIDCHNWSIKTLNLQVNADIILEIYVSIKGSPFEGTRQPLCVALCIFIKALKGNGGGGGWRGWGAMKRGG